MNIPKRKGNAPVEATQELQALDVLEIVETLKSARPAPGTGVSRTTSTSNSSIAPVGLDLMPQRAVADEEANPTMEIRLPAPRRRRLGGIVIGAIAGCALILVAAGIARVGHASSSPSTAPATTAATTAPSSPATATPPAATAPAATSPAPTSLDVSSTGTVRLDRPALAGHVWLDGKKLSATSALVSCGTHQIKVGRGRTHSVDVPCGSEIGVSK